VSSPLEDAYELVKADPAPLDIGEQTLRYLGIAPDSLESHALVLLCRRYRLDPLLGHIELITVRGGKARPYITRDGLLEIAHRSGQLDGITVDEQRRNSTGDGWTCFVTVWRRDMSHGFRFGAQCKDTEAQAKDGHGPEMALARAERRALKRAFNVAAYIDDDEFDPREVGELGPVADGSATESSTPPPVPTKRRARTPRQLEQIRALMTARNVTDDAVAAVEMTRILERPVGPDHDPLTFDEAATIIAHLQPVEGP